MDNDSLKTKTTRQTTKNELFVQVYLPLVFTIIVFIVFAVFIALDSSPASVNIHHWANISVVFLSVPMIISTFITILLSLVLIFGLDKAIQWLPVPLKKVHLLLLKIQLWLWDISEKITSPVINMRSKAHSLRKLRISRKNNLIK
jgi:hypothetical protein